MLFTVPRRSSQIHTEYVLEDSSEESDDIVVHDTETSHYRTVADRDR